MHKMRRGWYNESWRHSLSAKGIRTGRRFYQRKTKKSDPFSSLVERRKILLSEVKKNREGAKRAQEAKEGMTPKNRKKLEELRKMFAEQRDDAKDELNQVNKLLKTAEEEGSLSAEARRDALELDRELRQQRTERAREVQKKVKEGGVGERFLPGTPTKARMRVIGPGIVGTKKADVIISGEQGLKREREERQKELDEILMMEELGIEAKQKPEKKKLGRKTKKRKRGRPKKKVKGFEIELTEEEIEEGKKKKVAKRRAARPKETQQVQEEMVEERETMPAIFVQQTKEDVEEQKKTEEEFVDLEKLMRMRE